tara:strand:- start:954 stop:1226 length:273 start_codon:yes stop_codon:yes gene_type:complete
MEKIIFFGLVIPIFLFVFYLGGRAIMSGFSAKSANRSQSEIDLDEKESLEDSPKDNKDIASELNKLNELLKSGALTQEEFEKAKNKILDN